MPVLLGQPRVWDEVMADVHRMKAARSTGHATPPALAPAAGKVSRTAYRCCLIPIVIALGTCALVTLALLLPRRSTAGALPETSMVNVTPSLRKASNYTTATWDAAAAERPAPSNSAAGVEESAANLPPASNFSIASTTPSASTSSPSTVPAGITFGYSNTSVTPTTSASVTTSTSSTELSSSVGSTTPTPATTFGSSTARARSTSVSSTTPAPVTTSGSTTEVSWSTSASSTTPAPVTTSGSSTESAWSTSVSSTTPAPVTTSGSSAEWAWNASGPLPAVRNCYLAPLREGEGCTRLAVLEGIEFGLNKFGQETSAKGKCLELLRASGGNTFLFALGRCELWNCTSKDALKWSAGPSTRRKGIFLQDLNGKFLSLGNDQEVVAANVFIGPSAMEVVWNEDETISLRSPAGKYVAAEPSGRLHATRDSIQGWEKFHVTRHIGGSAISLKSYHGHQVAVQSDRVLAIFSDTLDESNLFILINQTAAAPEGVSDHVEEHSSSDASVYSKLCSYQEPFGGIAGQERRSPVFVKLWEWSYDDIARECQEYLGPIGVDAVQISPVTEHVLGSQWWVKYQPVSFGLSSRAGSPEQLRHAVAECRAAGVEVIVDVVLNHITRPCAQAAADDSGTPMPCTGWNGTAYGSRQTAGAGGWDAAGQEFFHHFSGHPSWGQCGVGPETGFLCNGSPTMTDCSCCQCDMYGLPDWNQDLPAVQEMHSRHLSELHSMGVTMLRLDAALYMEIPNLASIVNRLPWDIVYQEWWNEDPVAERTEVVGHYRDVTYIRRVVDKLAVRDIAELPDLLQIAGGQFGIPPEHAVYPVGYHDWRTNAADPAIATYKNGLEYHQQQKYVMAAPFGVSVMLFSSFGWTDKEQGPPGCESGDRCAPLPVFDESGRAQCMDTPSQSPLPLADANRRAWVCEHRWAGVAGLIRFRKACRGLPITQTWSQNEQPSVSQGNLAFRLGEECFVALVRGYNMATQPSWGQLEDWSLTDLVTGLPPGRYCDLAALGTAWDGRSCERQVLLGEAGRVLNGTVPQGDLLAIHAGSRLEE